MSAAQKKRSIAELHSEALLAGYENILEVSTKSEVQLGRRLSAFALDVELSGVRTKIECLYQGSKVFQKGGPFVELIKMKPLDAKRYFKERDLGAITHFEFMSLKYDNWPHHAFYDWLFVRALSPHADFLRDKLSLFNAYSDIEFNPNRSINTQARSVAIIACLLKRPNFSGYVEDYNFFRDEIEQNRNKFSSQIELGLIKSV